MKRSFLFLAVLTALALLLVVLTPQYRTPESSAGDALLLSDIAERINEVDRLEVVAAGNRVVATMTRSEAGWQLEQMGAYHASWEKIQPLLAALAQARVVATKTDKPEYYARLGVEDITADAAASVLLNIGIAGKSSGILLGNQTQGRQGQYVRLRNQASSAEIDRRLDVSTDVLDWVDSAIIDINSSEVAEVEVIHPQGERLLVMRISADQTDFDLVGLPEGREIKSSWAVNSLGSVLSMLELETVRKGDDISWDDAVRLRLLMFSGVEVIAELMASDEQYLLRLRASHPAAKVVNKPTTENDSSSEQQGIEKRAAADISNRVAEINQKTDAWVYGISEQKYAAMTKKPEDLLKPLEEP